MIILYIIGGFVLGFLIATSIISILSASSKEAAVAEALQMGYEMAKIDNVTIDVTELPGIGKN